MNKLPAATTAHTAAALQSRVAIDIQTGRILKPKPNPHLGGDVSKPRGGDVSYLHDTPGHNMSSIAAARATPLPKLQRSSTTEDIADPMAPYPASRADAIAVGDTVRAELAQLGPDAPPTKEAEIWDTAFAALTQQVTVHCAERGAILDQVRLRQLELNRQMKLQLAVRDRELAAFRAAHEEMVEAQKREAGDASKAARHLGLFQRAFAQQMNLRSKEEIEGAKPASRRPAQKPPGNE